MKKLAKGLYGMNSIANMFIGVMHTLAHFKDLTTTDIQNHLAHDTVVSGIDSNIYDLWQGMSLMMGGNLFFIGVLHLYILIRTPKIDYPPIGGSVIMIVMLALVIIVGNAYFSQWQVYGGIVGIVVQSVCLFLSAKKY